TCSSSELSCVSPNSSHHLPFNAVSFGWALFQPAGGASLNAGAAGTFGFAYFGPTEQPANKSASAMGAKMKFLFIPGLFIVVIRLGRPAPDALAGRRRWNRLD